MTACATVAQTGGFVATDTRWTFEGSLTFADAPAVFAAAQALPMPASGVVDLAGLEHADSSALAVMLALKRRATAQGTRLQFTAIPQGIKALASVYGVDELLAD
jgi:phospholipid transport system transporter-binding protein